MDTLKIIQSRWFFIFLIFLAAGCGSLDDSDLLGETTSIKLIVQNPDESASGIVKAVDGIVPTSAVSKSDGALGVTSCNVCCGTVCKDASFASGASQVEVSLDCVSGSQTISATCPDSSKTSNSVKFGFTCSTTVTISGNDKITCTGQFLNQATRSSGDCRYAKVAQDNNTQTKFICGFDSALTDAQKTTAKCHVEFNADETTTSPQTVDTSSDGLQPTTGNSYITMEGGIITPSCFRYNTSGVKQQKGTAIWQTDADGNSFAQCIFGVRQWKNVDSDRNARYAASCSKDGSDFVLIPSSGMAKIDTSPAGDGDIASTIANGSTCATSRSGETCSDGICAASSICAAVSVSLANNVENTVGPGGVDTGSGQANGAAPDATFDGPVDVCLSPDGNSLYVVDQGNHIIRLVDFTLATTSASYVTTFCGTADTAGSTDGACSTAARFSSPEGCVANQNNLFVSEVGNDVIRQINLSTNISSTLAGTAGSTGTTDGTGSAARFNNPMGLAIDANNNLFVADNANFAIRKITSGAVVTTLAGGCQGSTNGTGTAACFDGLRRLVLDSTGTKLYVADPVNSTIRVVNTVTQVVTNLVTSVNGVVGIAIDPTDSFLYTTTGGGNLIQKTVISTGTTTTIAGSATSGAANGNGTSATFNQPIGMIFNPVGNTLYIGANFNNKIRQIQ